LTIDRSPIMDGFEWSPTTPFVPTEPGEDGWCVRDAFCELLRWGPDSHEWSQVVEAPDWQDMPKLAEHLGLTFFGFPEYDKAHTLYVHDVRWLLHNWPTLGGPPAAPGERPVWKKYGWPLGDQYLDRGPVLGAVIINEHEPPHAV